MTATRKGSCACGAIRFTLAGAPLNCFNCHCTVCRKMNGSAFSTYVVFKETALILEQGASTVRAAAAGTNATRHFCAVCGTPLYGLHRQAPGLCLVSLGALDDDLPEPVANVFCRSSLPWVFDLTGLARHETVPDPQAERKGS